MFKTKAETLDFLKEIKLSKIPKTYFSVLDRRENKKLIISKSNQNSEKL